MKRFFTLLLVVAALSIWRMLAQTQCFDLSQIYDWNTFRCINYDFTVAGIHYDGHEYYEDYYWRASNAPDDHPRHTLMTEQGQDDICPDLNVLPPEGGMSVRLASTSYAAKDSAQGMACGYVITISEAAPIIKFHYAAVMENPKHELASNPDFYVYAQPNFNFSIYSLERGNQVFLKEYYMSVPESMTDWKEGVIEGEGNTTPKYYMWKDWTTVSIDLSNHIGERMTISINAFDCSESAYDPENHRITICKNRERVRLYYTLSCDIAKCGDNLTWSLNQETGVLTIAGTGAMYDYSYNKRVPWYSFRNSITSVIIPNSVTSIGSSAFGGCSSLTSVTIPNSVTSIGSSAFYNCSSLTSVTIGNSVISIGKEAFYGCSSLTSITIPNSVTSIGDEAFSHCSGLTSVTIPNSVTSIGSQAFYYCSSLTSVTIGNSVTSIGSQAFYYCSSLTSVTIEAETPPTLGNSVFTYCTIYVPCGTLDAYKTAWSAYASRIKYVPYSYTITPKAINGYITTTSTHFTMCDTEHPVICTANPDRGFYFVRWADGNTENPRTIELTQDTTMEAIFDYLLTGKCGKDSALTWTFEPASMALSITGKGALSENYTYGAFIESLTIGNEITCIGERAFGECNNLKNVIIGSSVKVLEAKAFYGCSTIETITCYSQRPPTVNQNALYGLDYNTIVYVPADYLNTYKMHDAWGLYDVRPLGATEVETEEVTITPSNNTVDIVWPTITGATTYELIIRDTDGNIVCTLIFDAQGHLTQIAFAAPARTNVPEQTQTAGFSFTVTGLNSGTTYDYTLTAKDAAGNVLDTQTGAFTTDGATALDNTYGNQNAGIRKVFENGQLYILLPDNTRYNLQGTEVK